MNNKFPSTKTLVMNFLKAMKRVFGRFLSGKKVKASEETSDVRSMICQNCEMFEEERCLECGCFISAKIKIASESCPLGYWDEEE
jgi:hypothetical protein